MRLRTSFDITTKDQALIANNQRSQSTRGKSSSNITWQMLNAQRAQLVGSLKNQRKKYQEPNIPSF